jgi:hypothetical protein
VTEGPESLGVTWSATINEVHFILWKFLRDSKKLVEEANVSGGGHIITPTGWEHIAKLQTLNSESNICFVAMRFSNKLKTIYSNAIKPTIDACGYEPKIMFEHNHINKIDDEIVAWIKKSRFVIADFTEQNQGAYYEAGYARGLG